MKTWPERTPQGPLCVNRGVLLALLISIPCEHVPAWIFHFISPSHPWIDLRQHFDARERAMGQWAIPSEAKSAKQNLQAPFSVNSQRILKWSDSNTSSYFKTQHLDRGKTSTCSYIKKMSLLSYAMHLRLLDLSALKKKWNRRWKCRSLIRSDLFMYVGYMYIFVCIAEL